MASKAVVDAVAARLGDTWNGITVVPPNTTDEPPADGSPYILLQFPVADTRRSVVNNRQYREEGGFRVVLHGTRGSGTDQILERTGELAALFRDRKFDGVETQVPSEPFIDDETGNYAIAAVVVPYTYDFDG